MATIRAAGGAQAMTTFPCLAPQMPGVWCDHYPPPALVRLPAVPGDAERVPDADRVTAAHDHAAGERAAIAAVQGQHDPPSAAVGHPLANELRGHGGRAQQLARLRVSGGQVQLAGGVLDAVTGKMQEQQVTGLAVGEEARDLAPEHMLGLVPDDRDVEPADLRIS
jgi:hypothetical protein